MTNDLLDIILKCDNFMTFRRNDHEIMSDCVYYFISKLVLDDYKA